jgi:hypothetical protein
MKRDYPLAPTPDPKFITAKRAYEVADSLDKESIAKKKLAYQQKAIGEATVKNKVADKQVSVSNSKDMSTWGKTLSGNDRLKIAKKAKQEATTDSANAARYRALADKALKKKK